MQDKLVFFFLWRKNRVNKESVTNKDAELGCLERERCG